MLAVQGTRDMPESFQGSQKDLNKQEVKREGSKLLSTCKQKQAHRHTNISLLDSADPAPP